MENLHRTIMNMNFKKIAKRFVLAALCVMLIGGAVSAIALRTQISEVIALEQAEDESELQAANDTAPWMYQHGHGHEAWQDDFTNQRLERISEPSAAAKAAVGITGLLCLLLGAFYWLLIAAWLYQAANLAGMHGLLWLLLGLGGNLAVVLLFWVARTFIRTQCPACGRWQANAPFCKYCGTAVEEKCPTCGAAAKLGDRFCGACGARLVHAEGDAGQKDV